MRPFAGALVLLGSAWSAYAQAHSAPESKPAVNLVVFSDFECPYSAEEYRTLEKLKAQYGERLHLVLKQAPLPIHPGSPLAHRAALAALRQGKYQAMAELLYANEGHQSRLELISYAKQLHLDPVRFVRDLDSPAVAAEMASDKIEADAFGIESTPTLYLNGKRMEGIQDLATLSALIDPAASPGAGSPAVVVPAQSNGHIDPEMVAKIAAGSHAVRGDVHAPLTIVEFTDFQCPFCRASAAPLQQLIQTRGADVRLAFRAFPLDFHPDAQLAAEAALAAGAQGKFWEMHDLLFANQDALKFADLQRYATQLGLNMAAFNEALTTHRFAGQIAEDKALGDRAGVNGTPTFMLGGEVIDGVRSLPELAAWVDAHKDGASATVNASVVAGPPALVSPEHPVAGPATGAAVELTWFTDVRSPSAAAQGALVRALVAHSKNRIRVLYKPFPMATREDGRLASAALLAAQAKGRFWEVFDLLAERRDVLDREKVVAVARAAQLDPTAFAADLDKANEALLPELEEAVRRGIQGAPVIFLNDRRVDGLQREGFYTAILDDELRSAPAAIATVR